MIHISININDLLGLLSSVVLFLLIVVLAIIVPEMNKLEGKIRDLEAQLKKRKK